MRITVFGLGYVGLVQAALFGDAGHEVACIDTNAEKIATLSTGSVSIHEPGLATLVQRGLEEARLVFSTDAAMGVAHGEVLFIAVSTPANEDGSADLSSVWKAAETIAKHMAQAKIIVNKSTVPVGTAEKVKQLIKATLRKRKAEIPFTVVSNPEFLKEGSAVQDFSKPDRIIIGTSDLATQQKLRELYAPFNRNHDRIIIMDEKSAELTKYAANCMLATKISFINEIANLAELLGADIELVRQGIGADPRIGYQFIYPGCGYGGSCFPKDITALLRTADAHLYRATLLNAVNQVNEGQKQILFKKLSTCFNGQLAGKTIAIWGLAFKPGTDDMREAPSRALMERLWSSGALVRAYDPEAMGETHRLYGDRNDLQLVDSKESALQGADALVICTEWQVFRAPDFSLIKATLNHPLIIDGRNLYDPDKLRSYGIDYRAVGRGNVTQPAELSGA